MPIQCRAAVPVPIFPGCNRPFSSEQPVPSELVADYGNGMSWVGNFRFLKNNLLAPAGPSKARWDDQMPTTQTASDDQPTSPKVANATAAPARSLTATALPVPWPLNDGIIANGKCDSPMTSDLTRAPMVDREPMVGLEMTQPKIR